LVKECRIRGLRCGGWAWFDLVRRLVMDGRRQEQDKLKGIDGKEMDVQVRDTSRHVQSLIVVKRELVNAFGGVPFCHTAE
jgi:hypothetical protein